MPRVYNEATFQYNTDVTYVGFIYRTSRVFPYNEDITYNQPIRYIGDSGVGDSTVSFRRNILRSGTNTGNGSATSSEIGVFFRDASGFGTSSESSSELEIIYVTAESEDMVNGSSTANVLKTSVRTTSNSGVGSSSVVRVLTAKRQAFDTSSFGFLNVAIGKNAGKTLNARIRMSPYWSKRKPRHIRIR